jgi:hypothetical protein
MEMSEDFAKCFSENKKQMNLDGGTNTSEVGEFSIIRLDFNDGDWRVRWKVFSRAVQIATGVTAKFLISPFRNLE